jgi:DNA modification methylase
MSQAKITTWTNEADFRGTFADNMRAPIHRWFRYPAGFSYGIVDEAFHKYHINKRSKVLDPFAGVGTTNVCAKKASIESIGLEAHPLPSWIAKVKTNWSFDLVELRKQMEEILLIVEKNVMKKRIVDIEGKPKLLRKCFSDDKLAELLTIKDTLSGIDADKKAIRDLCILALLTILRKVSKANTGWPYLLPKKIRKRVPEVLKTYRSQLEMMISDLEATINDKNKNKPARIITGDARTLSSVVTDQVDFVFTSPPYLNNYDYADRTRLELYFLSPFKLNNEYVNYATWNDLTRIREKLIVSASHQAVEIGFREGLLPDNEIVSPVKEELKEISARLRREKSFHGGHKDYDIMVVAYFNDIFRSLKEVFKVMKPHSYYLLILGDSAPYGVHVPTDVYIAKIARGIGFSGAEIKPLRKRGDKWKSAPKHTVPLRESMVILQK